MIENLIKVGAFSSFGKTRAQLMKVYEMAVDSALSISRTTRNGQLDITSLLIDDSSEIGIKNIEKLIENLNDEKVYFVVGHLLGIGHNPGTPTILICTL